MPDGTPAQALLRDQGQRAAMEQRLAEMRARHADAASPEAIAEVVQAVLASMQGGLSGPEAAILSEVEQLGRTIAQAKREIADLQMDDINGAFIPSATDELDAIVAATAGATNEILDAVETVEKVAGEIPPAQAEALRNVTTRIYEACSFQDITGQRVTKVVTTLKTIENKVNAIISTFGVSDGMAAPPAAAAATPPAAPAPPPAAPAPTGAAAPAAAAAAPLAAAVAAAVAAPAPIDESKLLNGPQLPGGGVDQASIDALFD